MAEPVASNYPASLDSTTTLMGDPLNLKQFTLDAGIDDVVTTISVAESITAVNVPLYILIDSELIYVEAKSSGDFATCTRGADGTTAASHTNGTAVYQTYAANMFDQLKRAIIATQTELGVAPKTIDDTVTPGASPTSVANLLDMMAHLLKSIGGASAWYNAEGVATPGGRLTLTTAVPVTTSDVTGATTVYYTPYLHDKITLWNGTRWITVDFSEVSTALGTLTNQLPYDVFGYLSAGALTLEKLAWTNTTTRATAVTLQDGRYCKSGDKTRLYLGTFFTTTTTTTEDSLANRLLFNMYNRVQRALKSTEGASHTVASAGPREWNNSVGTLPRCNFLVGVPVGSLLGYGALRATVTTANFNFLGTLNLDGTLDITFGIGQVYNIAANSQGGHVSVQGTTTPAVGFHYLTLFEQEAAGSTTTVDAGKTGADWWA